MQFPETDQDAVEHAAGAVLVDQAITGAGELSGQPPQIGMVDAQRHLIRGRGFCFPGSGQNQPFGGEKGHLRVISDGADFSVRPHKCIDAPRAELANDFLEGHEFTIDGLDETFHVLDGTIDIAVPFFLLTNRDTAGDGTRQVPFSVEVSYQACTGAECFMPETVTLELELHEAPNPGYETKDLAALAPLVMRRIVEGPKSEAELLDLVNAALEGVEVDAGEISDTLDVLKGRGLVDQNDENLWYETKGA